MSKISRPQKTTRHLWAVVASLILAGCSSCDGASDAPPGNTENNNNLNSSSVHNGDPSGSGRVQRSVAPLNAVHLAPQDAGN